MHWEEIRAWCLQQPGVTEHFPFDAHTLVFKVYGKMFALLDVRWEEKSVNLKCDPERALELRATWEDIRPGYHMNKQHWNTVHVDGFLPKSLCLELLAHSYDLVLNGIPPKKRIL